MATVLIVDDHLATLSALRRLIRLAGHETVCAEGGHAALRYLEDSPADIVLLDLMMPGIDGLEVLRTLRADPARRSLPVVMYSASDDDAAREEALRLGARDYLVKTRLDWATLNEKLAMYLAPQGVGA